MSEELEFHPLANEYPMLSDALLDELAEDIKRRGLLDDILLFDGTILDGRNRYVACKKAGVEPRFREYTGDDPEGEVASLNLHRRHLQEKMRAKMVAALRAKGWPQRKIAEAMNTSQKTVSRDLADTTLVKTTKVVPRVTDSRGASQPAHRSTAAEAAANREEAGKLKREGLSYKEIGQRMGFSPSTVAFWLNGRPGRGTQQRRTTKPKGRKAGHKPKFEAQRHRMAAGDFTDLMNRSCDLSEEWAKVSNFAQMADTLTLEQRCKLCESLESMARVLNRLSRLMR